MKLTVFHQDRSVPPSVFHSLGMQERMKLHPQIAERIKSDVDAELGKLASKERLRQLQSPGWPARSIKWLGDNVLRIAALFKALWPF
jgi:hypothetical protein